MGTGLILEFSCLGVTSSLFLGLTLDLLWEYQPLRARELILQDEGEVRCDPKFAFGSGLAARITVVTIHLCRQQV